MVLGLGFGMMCGDQTLKKAFLVLFSIASHEEALVADLVQFSNNSF